MKPLILGPLFVTALAAVMLAQHDDHQHSYSGPKEGLGRVHMDASCSAAVAAQFDSALALLQPQPDADHDQHKDDINQGHF